MTIKTPIITPRAVKGWVNHSSVLGSNNYDLNNLYSPDTAYDKSCVLDLASPKYNPHKTTIFDKSGYNNHGTITGATWEREKSGVGVNKFDGTDDCISITNSPSLTFTTTDFSFSFWYYTSTVGVYSIFCKGDGGTDGYWLLFDNDVLDFRSYEPAQSQTVSTHSITTNTWQHLVLTKLGTSVKLYRNDVYINAVSGSHGNIVTNNRDFKVGIWFNDINFPIPGQLGLIKSFNRALSVTEISNIFNQERSLFNV